MPANAGIQLLENSRQRLAALDAKSSLAWQEVVMEHHGKQGPSQRQLRVGEEIRSALAQIFAMGETHHPILDSASITVSEVRISPDLKNATAYVMPLAGSNKETVLAALKENAPRIRGLVSRRIVLRTSPRIGFKLDTSFEEAGRINQLLNSERVRADVEKPASDE